MGITVRNFLANYNPTFVRLITAGAFFLITGLALLDATAFNGTPKPSVHENGSFPSHRSFVQAQSATPTPEFLGRSDAQRTEQSNAVTPEQGTATSQIHINFDVLPSGAGVPAGTIITNQYPTAIFSSDQFHYVIADNQAIYWGTSRPNDLGRAPKSGFYDGTGYAPLYVDFTTPVNDLKFYVDAVDEFRAGIGQLNIFQNNHLTATRRIDGFGDVFTPITVDVGAMGFNNVTRIEVVNINDYLGVGFDDFSFTLAPAPSPTPTPQPTPTTPTGLTAAVTDRQVKLNWTGSVTAVGYLVKRSTTSGGPYTTIAAPGTNSYIDSSASGDTTYFYVVSAFNSVLAESSNSNQVPVSIPSACGDLPTNINAPGHIHSISGWDMTVEISANDGMVLRDVSLNGRYMAKSISIPYFKLATSKAPDVRRGELKPSSSDSTLRSRLVSLDYVKDAVFSDGELFLNAEYVIDRIASTSDSCLHVYQTYAFLGKTATKLFNGGRSCEPSGVVPCEMWSPYVSYKFESRNGDVLRSFTAVQRNQFWVNALPANGIGVFRDCDSFLKCEFSLDQGSAFRWKLNPVKTELKSHLIIGGQDTGQWDNIHETFNDRVLKEPGFSPGLTPFAHIFEGGCPECVHMHWRWGKTVPGDYSNDGVGFYYPNTNQDLDLAIVKYKSTEHENIEPNDYASLADGESIRLGEDAGDQVLVYFAATGHRQEDVFFRHLYFFNPDFGAGTKTLQKNSSGSSTSSTSATTPTDGPISVTFPHIYQDGTASYTEFDPSQVAALIPGYVAYNNTAYNVKTDAEVSGPYVVSFGVPSATDESTFNSLRILHLEADPLDPDNGIWVDRTILPPDVQAPNFNSKVVNSSVRSLDAFVIAKLVQPQPPNSGTADLSVSTSANPDPVVSPQNITYTITISNTGPDSSTGTGLIDSLSSDVQFVSVSTSQGTCKFIGGSVYCKLGSLNNGSTAVVTIVVSPDERDSRFPDEGQSILNTALVIGNESDTNKDNNTFVSNNSARPDPNSPPTVTITSPAPETRYVGPATITLSANASDKDGTVAQVNFYDGATLIGSGTLIGANQYSLSWNNMSFGRHSLVAVAADNGGRATISSPISVLVNGSANIEVNSPSPGSVISPHSHLVISANASSSSSAIGKVDFFANSTMLGTVIGGGLCSIDWNDVPNGKYAITAVATDGSGVTTTSMPVTINVSNAPTVSLTSPQNGATFDSMATVTITAAVQDDDTLIDKVMFYANGTLLGSGLRTGLNQFSFTWRGAPDGIFSLTAVTADQYGLTTTSPAITVGVNTSSTRPGEFIWFDDALPTGAATHTDDEGWYWVDANPAAFSGTKAHQSRNFAQLDLPFDSLHRHYFDGATMTLPVASGDKLFTYVFLDINNMPREIMLEWKDANSWEHRAYWGANGINSGVDGSNSRRYMGPLPRGGSWVRLEVPASAVGLAGSTLNGMAFTLDAGRATWDLAGKATASAAPPPTTLPGDSVWLEDDFPAGAIDTSDTVNDQWTWVANPRFSGQRSHESQVTADHNTLTYRSHAFKGAQTPMQVNPGDVLFTYVLIDPSAKADQIMLQWYDGSSWEHRAFWGENFINHLTGGVQGTESQRYMGGVPNSQSGGCGIPDHPGWCRLEVPASYIGLEGKSVTGMAFSIFGKEPTVIWDRSGKADHSNNVFLPLSATAAVWSLRNKNAYAYDINTQGVPNYPAEVIAFYAHSNQAAATVPFYRFHDFKGKFYYSTCRDCAEQAGWTRDGVAFYVYADGSTPGTVPLYEFHGSETFYYSITPTAPAGMSSDGIVAYVYPNSGLVPAPPSFLRVSGCFLEWRDNAWTETGFKIVSIDSATGVWSQLATVDANVNSFKIGCHPPANNFYIVRAYNSFGDSDYSNIACAQCFYPEADPGNTPPTVNITSPANGDVVDHNFAITGNAFDVDGNGSVAKVEFFANGSKVGEATDPPYVFSWNNAPAGTYTLVATATDAAGVTASSSPITVTVDAAPSVSITSPSSGAVFNATSTVNINAAASDNGTISKVEFFQGATKLGEDTTYPYAFDWNDIPAGSYSLTAVATDNLGLATTSDPVGITVNAPPTVNVTAPAGGSVFTAPAAVTINANASDSDGTISRVDFYQGITLVGSDTTSPYMFTWTNVPAGTYSITARAVDNLGAVSNSTPISITSNAPPTVNIIMPANGIVRAAPAIIALGASASDSDGTVSKVEFYRGSELLGTAATSPYSIMWTDVSAGIYSITAKATDNQGATGTSNNITITVALGGIANKIAFASNRDGVAQIHSMNADGSGVSQLTTNASNDECPRWSPNNSRIVFQSDRDNPFSGASDIYVMNPDGSGQTRLTSDVNDDSSPVWSPDGTKIAFQSARNGVNYQIYVMNADGSGQVNFSNSTSNDTQPSWSPDGSKIALASDRDQPGFPSIYVMNASGGNQTRLTFASSGFRDEQPAWSPDGTKLAFTSTRDSVVETWQETDEEGGTLTRTAVRSNKEVYVMNADGSLVLRLTTALENDDSPAWSSDGTKIIFRSERERDCCDPTAQVWVMNTDGSNQVNLSNNGFGDYCPSWSR